MKQKRNPTLTLYHGTSLKSAINMVKNGWRPYSGKRTGNAGNLKYLYLTTEIEDARWFSNELGEDTVLKVSNIPIEWLIVDPEDGIGNTVEEELKTAKKLGLPAKLALTHELDSSYFEVL